MAEINAWAGPYGGVPAFDKIKVEHFKPALEAAMAENLREVEAIANNPAPATFENTIVALGMDKPVHSDLEPSFAEQLRPIQNRGTSAKQIADICRHYL